MIRPATLEDAVALAEVHVSSWHGVYRGLIPDDVIDAITVERRTRQWSSFLERSPANEVAFVSEHDGLVVGLASLGPWRDDATETIGEVRSMYVRPDHWDHGHGRELMTASLTWLADQGFTEAMLWVLAANERGRRFYEKAGWAADGVEKVEDLFGAPVDEVRYRVALEG